MPASLTALRLISRLPLPMLQTFARGVGRLAAQFPSRGVAWTVRRNLLIAFPELGDTELTELTRLSLQSQAMSSLEFIKTWGRPPEYSLQQIRQVHGTDLFLRELAHPNGLIGIVPHFGTWEMINAWINQYTDAVAMYKPAKNPDLDTFVLQARSRLKTTLVPTNESGVKAIFRTLKQGGFTVVLPDHVPEASGGILSPFFGHPVLSTTLVSRLAQKTGCRTVMISCMRAADGNGFELSFDWIDEAIRDRDLQVSVDTLNQAIEQLIRRHPAQYHWAYKRFKGAPGFDGIYQITEVEARERLAQLRQAHPMTMSATN